MSRLDAANIFVRRGERAILEDVSLHAESGDFVAIIGANGAGKSTLLSVLAGLLKADSGAVMLDGISIRAL
ncbi:MAG TPA: ATP-binding cassette domain-containing protein, partial [Steroidobacteraceae bacterium]|nr:ATP-binding cassette domain-containing protein [Steroidobacteraceae bacterium]